MKLGPYLLPRMQPGQQIQTEQLCDSIVEILFFIKELLQIQMSILSLPSDTVPEAAVWPEVERAECLARGAALKWASGVFCRPENLERLSQYKKRESQRTTSIHTRLKVTTQTTSASIHFQQPHHVPPLFPVYGPIVPGGGGLGAGAAPGGQGRAEGGVAHFEESRTGVRSKRRGCALSGEAERGVGQPPSAPRRRQQPATTLLR